MMTQRNEGNTFMVDHPVKMEPTPRWIRVKFGGEFVADSKRALLLLAYGPGHLPTYFFPPEDVSMDLLSPGPQEDDKSYWTVRAGDKVTENAAWSYLELPSALADLKGYITFTWHKMDAWYEEEEEIFVHARDPYKRVDVTPSSRHVRIEINGQTVADTRRPVLLFETNLPVRYYIPREDVRMDLLQPAKGTTQCPYKGIASYWSVQMGDETVRNIVWSYPDPIPECPKIKGLLCFFNEKVDLYLDGAHQPKPITPWS